MTAENCMKLSKHFESIGDHKQAEFYLERAKKKGYVVQEESKTKPTSKK